MARSGHSLKHPRQLSAGSSKDLDALLVETQHGWHQWTKFDVVEEGCKPTIEPANHAWRSDFHCCAGAKCSVGATKQRFKVRKFL
jgi:hypothetical protein